MQPNPKILLNEWCQTNGHSRPLYTVVEQTGPSHRPQFSGRCVVGSLTATTDQTFPSKREMEKHLAEITLQRLTNCSKLITHEPDFDVEDWPGAYYLVDGDNQPNMIKWLLEHRKNSHIHVFVTKDTAIRESGVKIHRSKSDLRDATDVCMIIYMTRLLPLLAVDEHVYIVSNDIIFETFCKELNSPQMSVAKLS